jgi:hypothetical protein
MSQNSVVISVEMDHPLLPAGAPSGERKTGRAFPFSCADFRGSRGLSLGAPGLRQGAVHNFLHLRKPLFGSLG